MTHEIFYRLVLEEDAVITANSATTGGHQGLGYIPGAALLGAVARHFEEAQQAGIAWHLFHSGQVRFGDARWLDESRRSPALPVPLSFHGPKGQDPEDLADPAAEWFDFTLVTGDGRIGHKPINRGDAEMDPAGRIRGLRREFRLKTAVDYASQRASDGQLFGYDAISAGAELGFTVAIDLDGDDRDKATDLVQRAFADPIRLGRSRSAEFGRAVVHRVDRPFPSLGSRPLGDLDPGDGLGPRIFVVLVSDAVLIDRDKGGLAVEPSPSLFGLDPERVGLDRDRCFTQQRRWTPFNGFRRRTDTERVAWAAGTVLSFVGRDRPLGAEDLAACEAACARAVGVHRSEGLGRAIVNPPFLFRTAFQRSRGQTGFVAPESSPAEPRIPEAAPMPDDTLGRWLAGRARASQIDDRAWAVARERVAQPGFRRHARDRRGPGTSQWQAVREAARTSVRIGGRAGYDHLRQRLFGGKDGLCTGGTAKHRWGETTGHTASALLVDLVPERLEDSDLGDAPDDVVEMTPLVVLHVATWMARERQKRGKGGA